MKNFSLGFPATSITMLLVAIGAPLTGNTQYTIRRSSFSTIGVQSTGGRYSMRSCTSQPLAAKAMSGGTFSVQGRPWHAIALQTPGAPLLNIRLSAGVLSVFWPSDSAGFLLQETTELRTDPAATLWVNSTLTVTDNGAEKSVSLTPGTGRKYFRLQKSR